jgi:hypothetical protein
MSRRREIDFGLLLLMMSSTSLLLLLSSLNHVDSIKHDCIPPIILRPGNDNLSSMIVSSSNNSTQIDQINNRILELISPATK